MHAGADHTLLVLRRRDARDVLALAGLGSSVYGQLGPTGAAGANVEAVLVAEEATACATQELAAAQGTGGARTCVTGRMRVRRVAAACDSTLVLTERPACPPGSSSSPDGLGLMPCAPCPEGTYQPEPGQTSCLQCPPAMFSFRGSTVCAMCPQGQNTSSTGTAVGGCKPLCPVGFYGVSQSVGTLGLTPCQECPPGTFADSNGTAWPCTPCPQFSGSTRSGLRAEGECRPFCEPGTLSADGLAPCQLCPAGTYNEHRRNVSCAACPQGYSSEAGSTECTICPPGSFAPVENSSVCTLCNYGSYQPAEGQTACTQCPDFKSAPLRGATNESQCLPTVWQTWGAGNNAWGQLGSGFTWNETREVNFVAVIVASDPVQPRRGLDSQDVLQVSPGYAHTLFVTVSKRLYAAGHNDFGQLGFAPAHAPACQYADAPDLTCRFNPTPTATPVEVDPVRFNRTVALARAGRHFSVVLTEDGRLWSLGVNTYGQLGRRGKLGEDATGEWEAREVMPDVVDVAVGWYHVLVKASDGSVLAFGLNRFGQLGVEQNQGTWTPNPDPLLIPSGAFGGGAVAAMAAGGTFSVVLTSEGEVWTFGSNHKGQLGVAAQFGVWGGAVWVPQMVPQVWTQAPGGGVSVAATRIAAGAKHVVVQSSDGRLWGFGNNFYGQLASVSLIGDKTSTPYRIGVDLPTFGLDNTPFRDTSTVVAIACGSDHTIVQTDDFRLWFFGSNRHGQLLRSENAGEWEFNPEPRAVVPCDLFSDQEVCDGYIVDKFAAGGEHTLIITGSKSCPPGSRGPPPFGRPGQLGDCQTCPAGTYSAGAGSTTCTPCSPGTFAPAGAEACSVCPADTYASGPGNADCTACDPGEQTQSDGATSEEDCRAMCQPGSYSGDGMEPCQACGNGTYAAAVGAEACLACAVGKWAPAGSDRCNDCAEGTSTFPGAGGASADCKAVCAAGTRSASGLAPCEVCARGTTSTAGATACESCGPGQDTLGNASTECVVVCGAGFYGEDRGIGVGVAPCLPCARGYFAPGAATACEACAPGYVAASEGAAACVKCLRGTFAASKGQFACEECQPGTAQRREGQAGCEDCVRGTFAAAAGAEECLECGAGLTSEQDTRSTGCQPCAAGTFLDSNTKRCSECEPGTFALASAAQCEPCPVGSYQPAAGASACERCVVGTTEVEGATSAGECRGLTEGRLTVSRASGMPTAGAEARLELELMPLMNVVAGERIVLGLPGFTNTRGSSAIELGGDAAASLTGTWNNASEALPFNALVLTVRQGQGVDRLNLVQLTVAESEGIRLPLLGLTSVSPPVTLSTNAAAGMVPPTPVDNVTPVGSFGASSTAIWDGSRLSLAAMPMMQMVEGDSLIVTLPIMLRSAGGNETTAMLPLTYGRRLDGLFGAEATWTAADNTLRLTIAPGQAQSPPVHAESSVAVMVGGLMLRPGPWQIGALTIASDAVAGPVPATTVQRVCKQEPGTPTMCCPGYTPSCLYA